MLKWTSTCGAPTCAIKKNRQKFNFVYLLWMMYRDNWLPYRLQTWQCCSGVPQVVQMCPCRSSARVRYAYGHNGDSFHFGDINLLRLENSSCSKWITEQQTLETYTIPTVYNYSDTMCIVIAGCVTFDYVLTCEEILNSATLPTIVLIKRAMICR